MSTAMFFVSGAFGFVPYFWTQSLRTTLMGEDILPHIYIWWLVHGTSSDSLAKEWRLVQLLMLDIYTCLSTNQEFDIHLKFSQNKSTCKHQFQLEVPYSTWNWMLCSYPYS